MPELEGELLDHFRDVTLATASHLQSWSHTPELIDDTTTSNPCDEFGEVLKCIDRLSAPQVIIKLRKGSSCSLSIIYMLNAPCYPPLVQCTAPVTF